MRIAVLWSHRSGYFDACLRALQATTRGATLLVHELPTAEAPYELPPLGDVRTITTDVGQARIAEGLASFDPDVLLVGGWQSSLYRKLARAWKGRAARILAMDNTWIASPRQRLGVLLSPVYLQPLFDAVFVPGERQAAFASKLGFKPDQIVTGLYSCDTEAFRGVAPATNRAPQFLYVGRLSQEKGIVDLLSAYKRYSQDGARPWKLRVVGTGPLRTSVDSVPGVEFAEFVQPSALPMEYAHAGALILPSRFEPWGLVVHEAATAGLPVICTDAVGSSVHLVSNYYSGRVVPTGNPAALARAMTWISTLGQHDLNQLGQRSKDLAGQYTPDLFAARLLAHFKSIRPYRLG